MNSQTHTTTQTSQQTQIDKREILAIIKAVAKKRSFVVWYGDIAEELSNMIENYDEYHRIENRLYEDVADGNIRNVYRFDGPCGDSECDIIIVSPISLDEKHLKIIEELVELYRFRDYDGDEEERGELTLTLHNLIKKWSSGCLYMSSPAESIYELAKEYGLKIEEEDRLNSWYAGKIYYRVEGLDTRIVKDVDYCNSCIDYSTGQNFIEKCQVWHFENDED